MATTGSDERLLQLREARGFDVARVAEAKIARIASWFRENKLDSAVVGVSGGVDSALVLALLMRVSKLGDTPLRRVVALLLPIESRGATKQKEATQSGRVVTDALNAETWEAPLRDALANTVQSLEKASALSFDAWSEGQCLSIMRTPALYGAAALLQTHGYRSVVVGTTNRDEGSYLGFFGKASDAMVDVQPISDLHKAEVRALALYLGVPNAICDAVPKGDVHDGRSDEEMIGASYDDVELFLRLRESNRDPRLSMNERAFAAIERIHAHNRHKYVVGNSAVHLDVMPRGVPDGWSDVLFAGREEKRPPSHLLPGSWTPSAIALDSSSSTTMPVRELIDLHLPAEAFACRIRHALTSSDCDRLIDAMSESGAAEPVGVTGIREKNDAYGIGSTRATAWAPELAKELFKRIQIAIPSVRFLSDKGFTDHFATDGRPAHKAWRLVGLTPLLRFMRYEPGGRHLCHYDAAYDYGDGRRTLMSVVFYLSDAEKSGATRFVRDRDGQEALPTHLRDFSDWDRDTREEEVIARVAPSRGDVLVFDHRLCHDVEQWKGAGPQNNDRVIIRADVVYEAIPPSAWRRS